MTLEEIQSGKIFLLNKPVGWTSFDVVNKIRWAIRNQFQIKKIKVGHAGSLDPFATGLLILCTGKGTKRIDQIVAEEKEYISTFQLGFESTTYDSTGEIRHVSNQHTLRSDIETAIKNNFIGQIEQETPMFSAKKIDGTRLYKLARKGISIARAKTKVRITKYRVLSYRENLLTVLIQCSKGTYIRSLAHDLGRVLGCSAYCKNLERSRIGQFSLRNANSIEECIASIKD